tara:strand:+ start:2353 stop:2778 length:426 start_codon:yes stop_codon:yes gene_type:complete
VLALAIAPAAALAASTPMHTASQSLTAKALASSNEDTRRQLLEQAIVADPANAAALSALADHYIKIGKPTVARKYFRIALTVDPVDVVALGGLGALDFADGKRDAAQTRLDLLKRVCPDCRQTRKLDNKFSTNKPSPADRP